MGADYYLLNYNTGEAVNLNSSYAELNMFAVLNCDGTFDTVIEDSIDFDCAERWNKHYKSIQKGETENILQNMDEYIIQRIANTTAKPYDEVAWAYTKLASYDNVIRAIKTSYEYDIALDDVVLSIAEEVE